MTYCEIPEIVSTKNYFWNVYLLFDHLDAWWNYKKKPQTTKGINLTDHSLDMLYLIGFLLQHRHSIQFSEFHNKLFLNWGYN